MDQLSSKSSRIGLIVAATLWSAASLQVQAAAPGSDATRSASVDADSDNTGSAGTGSTADEITELKRELQRAEDRIRSLEERQQAESASAAPAPPPAQSSESVPSTPVPAPAVGTGGNAAGGLAPNALLGRFDSGGFTLASADGADVLHLRGNISVDGRYFDDSYTPATADTWLLRRLRPTLEGTVDNIYDFRIMPDFGQGKALLQDGWFDARIEPWFVITAGKFKAPVGLERLQLEQYARFIEAALPSDLMPYRDLGAKIGGSIGGIVSYDVGLFDGTVDAASTDGNTVPDENATGKFTWEGRVYAQPFLNSSLPFRTFGFGLAGTYVNRDGVATTSTTSSLLASYKTPGQQSMFSFRSDSATTFNNATIAEGIDKRLVPQFYLPLYSVSLLGEYVVEDQQVARELSLTSTNTATLRNKAWQLQAAWFITGEHEAYDNTTPRHPVGQGGWGAWELVARIHALRFDDASFTGGANSFVNPATSPRAVHAFATGVNWYLNQNFKVQLDYELSGFEGGATVGNRPDEHVLTSQFVLAF